MDNLRKLAGDLVAALSKCIACGKPATRGAVRSAPVVCDGHGYSCYGDCDTYYAPELRALTAALAEWDGHDRAIDAAFVQVFGPRPAPVTFEAAREPVTPWVPDPITPETLPPTMLGDDSREAERAAIVGWLRSFDPTFVSSMHATANSIERGLHHSAEPDPPRPETDFALTASPVATATVTLRQTLDVYALVTPDTIPPAVEPDPRAELVEAVVRAARELASGAGLLLAAIPEVRDVIDAANDLAAHNKGGG